MYANICRTTNSIEREIAERQLGMNAINDNSWFSKLSTSLEKFYQFYSLGSFPISSSFSYELVLSLQVLGFHTFYVQGLVRMR
jgi:hypothetical protein